MMAAIIVAGICAGICGLLLAVAEIVERGDMRRLRAPILRTMTDVGYRATTGAIAAFVNADITTVGRVLRRLEAEGVIEGMDGELAPERGNRPRRYYRLRVAPESEQRR